MALAACGSGAGDAADTTVRSEHADEPFCEFQLALNASDVAPATPAEFEQYFTEVVLPAVDRLVTTAPADLADEAAVLADGMRTVGRVLERNEWNAELALVDPEVEEVFASQAYAEAGKTVSEYCGF